MSSLPPIIPQQTIVIPAIEQKVYDKLWLQRLIIEAPHPSKPVTVYVELVPYDGNGNTLTAPLTYNTITDAFELSIKDPLVAQVVGGVILIANRYKNVDFSQPFIVNADGSITQPVPVEETTTTTTELVEETTTTTTELVEETTTTTTELVEETTTTTTELVEETTTTTTELVEETTTTTTELVEETTTTTVPVEETTTTTTELVEETTTTTTELVEETTTTTTELVEDPLI